MGTSRIGLYLNTEGSRTKISAFCLVHSNEGTFMNVGPKKPKNAVFRLRSGGHGEDNIKLLKKYKIKYVIVKTYPNGVRVGSVNNHYESKKRTGKGTEQLWFPKTWTAKDIKKAGEHVASLKKNRNVKAGKHMTGMYKGVRVVVIKNQNTNIPATICPSTKQPKPKKIRR